MVSMATRQPVVCWWEYDICVNHSPKSYLIHKQTPETIRLSLYRNVAQTRMYFNFTHTCSYNYTRIWRKLDTDVCEDPACPAWIKGIYLEFSSSIRYIYARLILKKKNQEKTNKRVKLMLIHQVHVFIRAVEPYTLSRSFQTPHNLVISECTMEDIWTSVKDTQYW